MDSESFENCRFLSHLCLGCLNGFAQFQSRYIKVCLTIVRLDTMCTISIQTMLCLQERLQNKIELKLNEMCWAD